MYFKKSVIHFETILDSITQVADFQENLQKRYLVVEKIFPLKIITNSKTKNIYYNNRWIHIMLDGQVQIWIFDKMATSQKTSILFFFFVKIFTRQSGLKNRNCYQKSYFFDLKNMCIKLVWNFKSTGPSVLEKCSVPSLKCAFENKKTKKKPLKLC